MYKKIKHILLALSFIGLLIFAYEYYQNFNGNYFLGISESGIKISAVLLALILVFFAIPREYKQRNNKVTVLAVGIVLIFLFHNLNRSYMYYSEYRYEKVMTEYQNLGCNNMPERFKSDLSNNNLKFFSGGIAYNENLGKYLKKQGIEEFFQGCLVNGELECYTDLVVEYLKKEKNADFNEILKY
jgi:hypothetical protein